MNPQATRTLCESLFDNIGGLAHCQMIFDVQEHPIDFIFIRINKNFEKLTGLKNSTGKKMTELVPEIRISNPELFEIFGQVSLSGKPEVFEIFIKPLEKWFFVSVYSPKKNFFVSIFQNITEKKQVEKELGDAKIAARNVLEDLQIEKEALAHAKAKDEAILQSIGEGLVAIDNENKILLINAAAKRMLNVLNDADVIGKKHTEIWSVTDNDGNLLTEEKRPISIVLATRIPFTTTCQYVRKDDSRFPAAVTVTPVILGDKIIGVIDVFRDITREKELEKLRIDFLSLASHQLRTPLSGTKWIIETIQRGVTGELNPKQKEYINTLYQINERMIKLVFEMLNVLRLESGDVAIKKQEVSISKLYEELFLMTESASQNKGVVLHNAIKNKEDIFIQSDFQILRNILESFVSNAINYSQNGQKVVLDAKEEADSVILSVKDNGIGIPKEEQKKISERFYRASNAKKIKPDGTGLGLYITFLLAPKIGGKIYYKSEENKETIFYLQVPKNVKN